VDQAPVAALHPHRLDYGQPDQNRFWAGGEADLDRLLAAVGIELQADDDVVEIGCGLGRLTRPLAARVARVRALDVSPAMLERARELNPGLANVEWLRGAGSSLAGIEDASASACVSHVVFQHIPDPRVTLAYVREMGRVLRPGCWAAFQVSNDPAVHTRPGPLRRARRALAGLVRRAPRGQADPAWLGSHVELADLEAAAADGGITLEHIDGTGTQFCLALARRAEGSAGPAARTSLPAGRPRPPGALHRRRDGLVEGRLGKARRRWEAGLAQASPQRLVPRQASERGGERRRAVGLEQQAVLLVAEVLPGAARARSHDRAPDGHRLERHEAHGSLHRTGNTSASASA